MESIKFAIEFTKYFSLMLGIIGLVGNISMLIVYSKSATLGLGVLPSHGRVEPPREHSNGENIRRVSHFDVYAVTTSELACKTWNFVIFTSGAVSGWLELAAALDPTRFAASDSSFNDLAW